jgi:hypothetical protein
MTEERIDMFSEEHCCECAVCGGHRAAYSYPPVCKRCQYVWEYETNFNRWSREQVKK